ncbi:maleylpyruvate isomerase family mycothiol-dependent enzyme [Streptomyces sp. RY43-2]|uniref:Maleylpyruvate isomerase family mycothiol-dependent enzyme n=1 Tax=Streptomyces macrolidinus TaxID=2952607 RepID=A0ABT0ZLP8_9ACTN|nr:maleylpyruvate isomerase family mycothiol-dependent enzyme [Streptomyces macrolidinus]MCN9244518.1 maleylpyruvate isomerase family mycothiol-dependent enzyme [Streptomyces macrolidinus]
MASLPYLQLLRQESAAFSACLEHDLSVPVPHCGDWTLRDLAEHMGQGNRWAAAAVTDQRSDYEAPPAPRVDTEVRRWFDASADELLAVLDTDPAVEAWTFYPPHTVGFWQRRRAQETLIHRWDAQNAMGEALPLGPELAADGVAEVFDTMAPRQIARGRAEPPRHALRFRATDIGQSWTYGPGEPVAEISGTAERLLLLLWGRLSADDPTVSWSGDRAAGAATLSGPLTP